MTRTARQPCHETMTLWKQLALDQLMLSLLEDEYDYPEHWQNHLMQRDRHAVTVTLPLGLYNSARRAAMQLLYGLDQLA